MKAAAAAEKATTETDGWIRSNSEGVESVSSLQTNPSRGGRREGQNNDHHRNNKLPTVSATSSSASNEVVVDLAARVKEDINQDAPVPCHDVANCWQRMMPSDSRRLHGTPSATRYFFKRHTMRHMKRR